MPATKRRAIALLGPGLDGCLAIELVRRQGIEVIAATLATACTTYRDKIEAAAATLGVELITLAADEGYYYRVRHPRFGYTRERAPCLDCRVFMLEGARRAMAEHAASFVITGDVVGQRNPGQTKRDLALVDFHAGMEGLVLRPLSAQLLAPTQAENHGLVDRQQLLNLQGRDRKGQHALARAFGWTELPAVTSGCLLADAAYAKKLEALLAVRPHAAEAELALLALGRHERLDEACWIVLGRSASENGELAQWHARYGGALDAALLMPKDFAGPTAIVVGASPAAIDAACRAVLERSKRAGEIASGFVIKDADGRESCVER